MKDYIRERVISVAKYIIATDHTVRQAAKIFGVSKSTIHADMSDRLYKIDRHLYNVIRKIFERHQKLGRLKGARSAQRKALEKHKGGE